MTSCSNELPHVLADIICSFARIQEHAMINKQLLDPLRESWEMAHTKQPPEQQPTQLPTSLKTLDQLFRNV